MLLIWPTPTLEFLQFVRLRQVIRSWRHSSHFIPTLPGRTFLAPAGCIGEHFLERRRVALQAFLRSVANNPRLLELRDVLQFLGYPSDVLTGYGGPVPIPVLQITNG